MDEFLERHYMNLLMFFFNLMNNINACLLTRPAPFVIILANRQDMFSFPVLKVIPPFD